MELCGGATKPWRLEVKDLVVVSSVPPRSTPPLNCPSPCQDVVTAALTSALHHLACRLHRSRHKSWLRRLMHTLLH